MLHQEKSLQHTRHASEPGQTGEFAGQVVISLKNIHMRHIHGKTKLMVICV